MIKELLEKLNKTSETDFTTAVKIEDLSRWLKNEEFFKPRKCFLYYIWKALF
jgi:hypothetical protein